MLRSGWNLRGGSTRGRGDYGGEHQHPGGFRRRTGSSYLLCSLKGQFLVRSRDNRRLSGRLSSLRSARRGLAEWRGPVKLDRPTQMSRGLYSGSPRVRRRLQSANYENGRPRQFWNGHIRTGPPPEPIPTGAGAIVPPSQKVRKMSHASAWSGGRSAPDQIAFEVHGSDGAVQKGSDAGRPSGSRPTAHRYALPEQM